MQNYYEKLIEEYNKQNPGALPEDAASRMPEAVGQELSSRIPQLPAPVSDPSNFDVHVSDNTVTMNGRPESLPSHMPPMSSAPETPNYEVINDEPKEAPEPMKSQPDAPKAAIKETDMKDILTPPTDNDKAAREAGMADLEKRRKRNIVSELAAGAGDAISAGASAFGGNAPGGSQARLVERHEKDMDQGKKDIEVKLRNDPNSDISKQYQDLLARMLQKDPKDPALLGMTANQIAEKVPMVEKLVSTRQQDELTRLKIQENKLLKQQQLDSKKQAVTDKKEGAITEAKNQAGIIRQTIKDIKDRKLVGYDTAGPAGSSWLAPLDQPDLVNKLNTIKANIAFTTLNKMRQNSPTGGAVGQVSDKDMALLQSVLGSLETRQSPAQLKESLERLDQIYAKVQGYDADINPTSQPKAAPVDTSSRKTKSGHSYRVD